MVTVDNLEDFVKYNHKDVVACINHFYPNISDLYDIEDVTQSFYYKCASSKIIESYDPEKPAAFSTWMFVCIRNFIVTYYVKIPKKQKMMQDARSLQDPSWLPLDNGCAENLFPEKTDYIKSKENQYDLEYIKEKLKQYDKYDTYRRKIKFSKLFNYYLDDLEDIDISNLTGTTIAGVGSQKRKLRELVDSCHSGRIDKLIKRNILEHKARKKAYAKVPRVRRSSKRKTLIS